MTQDTWAYVTCNAGRVEYSIFDARDTRVAHGGWPSLTLARMNQRTC